MSVETDASTHRRTSPRCCTQLPEGHGGVSDAPNPSAGRAKPELSKSSEVAGPAESLGILSSFASL